MIIIQIIHLVYCCHHIIIINCTRKNSITIIVIVGDDNFVENNFGWDYVVSTKNSSMDIEDTVIDGTNLASLFVMTSNPNMDAIVDCIDVASLKNNFKSRTDGSN